MIGFGSGVTIGAVTQFPIARADVVELEPAVVEAGSRFFAPYNHEPTKDPRVRVIDLTEWAPPLDPGDLSALTAARWLAECLAGFEAR